MSAIPKALVPTIVIIALLGFFVLLVIFLCIRRVWITRQQRTHRLTTSDVSRQSMKKMTIEKGRVISTTETFTDTNSRYQSGLQPGFWSIRRVPLSSSAERSDRRNPRYSTKNERGHGFSAEQWNRPNINSVLYGKASDAHDLAEKGMLGQPTNRGSHRASFAPLAPPQKAVNPSNMARDQSMDFRIQSGDYADGLRLAPLTTERLQPHPKTQRPMMPSAQRPGRNYAQRRAKLGRPSLHVPVFDRRQPLFTQQADLSQVFESLENAPPSRKSRAGLWSSTLAKAPRLTFGFVPSRSLSGKVYNSRNSSLPGPRPKTRGKGLNLPTRRVVSTQDRIEGSQTIQAYVPSMRQGPSHRGIITSSFASTNKSLPDIPGELASRRRSIKVHQPVAIRGSRSPRTVDRLNSMLISIPGSPTESRPYATDEEAVDALSEISQFRPLSYVSSRRSRKSQKLPHRLSLASLGPDLRGFRKSIAPSNTSSPSLSISPLKPSGKDKLSTHSMAIQTDWLDTEMSDEDVPQNNLIPAPNSQTTRASSAQPPHRATLRPKSWNSLYDVSDVSSLSAPLPTKTRSGLHSRGLSALSAKSFGTISSLDNTYRVAEAMPVLAHGPPTPKDVSATPVQTEPQVVPSVPALPPPARQRPSNQQPITLKRLSQALPPSPPRPGSLVGKRKETVHPARRNKSPQGVKKRAKAPPPLDLRMVGTSGPRSSRLLKGPVSPMSVRTTDSLQRERSLNYTGYHSGTETSGSGKENFKGSVKSEPVGSRTVGKRPA
ncbi:MAG: hypothetical protein M1814_001103 [Vezdaea aestivalis]|nr:MAG: hypothetical protein M1814_001103 [Vezdaea aestivalis]